MYQDLDNMDSAIEEALAEDRLNSIDIDYLIEQINDQLNNLLSSSNKKNFLKSFEKQLSTVSLMETESDIKSIKESMYNLIIENIAEKFDMEIDVDNANIKKVSKQFYKFFVLNYIDNLSYFIKSYIVENLDDIVFDLKHNDHITTKKINEIDNINITMVMNNIGDVIDIIYNKNLDFSDFLYYLGMHPESGSCVEEMKSYLNDVIEDADSVTQKLMEPLINEEEGFGEIFVNIQMDLYNDFNNDEDDER